MGLGVDLSDHVIAIDDDQAMIDFSDPDSFVRDRLTDEVQPAVPMKRSFRSEFLDRSSFWILPLRW